MATDQYTQGRERSNGSTSNSKEANDHVPVTSLLAEEHTLRFAGVTDVDAEAAEHASCGC